MKTAQDILDVAEWEGDLVGAADHVDISEVPPELRGRWQDFQELIQELNDLQASIYATLLELSLE